MDRYDIVFLVLLLFAETETRVWYIENGGSNDIEKCGLDRITPCSNLTTVFSNITDNDTVIILPQEEAIHLCTGRTPIEITKNVTIKSEGKTPRLYCQRKTAFVINATRANIYVTFTGIQLVGENLKNCRQEESGTLHIENANVLINNCHMEDLCTAISLEQTKKHDKTLSIEMSTFNRISFVLTADGTRSTVINLRHSSFSGKAVDGYTSHAVSLRGGKFLIVNIQDCSFKNFHQGLSLTLNSGVHNIVINESQFFHNQGQVIVAKFSGGVEGENSGFLVSNSAFIENKGLFSSSLHLTFSEELVNRIKVDVDSCIFKNNEGSALFGTIYAKGIKAIISNSKFVNNVAGESHGTIQGFGGAIYVETETVVVAFNTKFINNTSTGFGGTVFSRGDFVCVDCSFYGADSDIFRPLLGDFIYATSGLILTNTTWRPTVIDNDKNKPLIWHPGSPTTEDWKIKVDGYFDAACPEGHNISQSGIIRNFSERTTSLTLSCKPCPRNQYSLRSGSLQVIQKKGEVLSHKKTTAYCHNCNYGGICSHGSIRAKANYYGFQVGSDNSQVHFISCPAGYCCHGKECKKYNSCRKNRTGVLCGKCKKGLGENLINSDCVKPELCNDMLWLLPIYVLAGFLYIASFMYLDYISYFFRTQLLWWEYRFSNNNHKSAESERATDTKDEHSQNYDNREEKKCSEKQKTDEGEFLENINDERCSNNHNKEIRNITGIRSEPTNNDKSAVTLVDTNGGRYGEPEIFTDFISLAFYFYQMFLLIRMRESMVMQYVIAELRSIYSSFFTLSIETKSHSFVVCPIQHLTAISKLVLIKSFSLYVLLLMFLVHIAIYIIQVVNNDGKRRDDVIHFSIRLKVATITILQLAYSTLTSTVMELVSCVNIGTEYVLLLDGSVKCYSWWQAFIMVIIIGWVLPFPVTLVQSLIHLRENVISYRQFITAWIIPLPYLLWCFWRAYKLKYHPESCTARQLMKDSEEDNMEVDLSIYEILYRLESPFKGKANHIAKEENMCYESMNIPQSGFWSGVMIGRRLVLILVFSFVQATVLRLYIALILCVLYLVHHLYYQPYLNRTSNIVETVSSVILVIFCTMNLFFAYSYVSDISPEIADENLALFFRWFETGVLVIFPSIVVAVLVVLILTRMVILLTEGILVFYHMCSRRR